MADIMNGRYALADPSSGLTVLSFEGGELNMFGSCTRIRTTQRDFYPQIQDEPTELKVENHIMAQLVTGLVVAAALAAVAVAVVVTGGAALAPLACALGGAAIGAGAVAIGTAVSDLETGYNRSWGDYWQRLITGSSIGFMAGASVYGLIAAVPAAASAAGVQASMMLGTSTFTAVTVPSIVTAGGYGLAAAGGIYTANDIYSNSRGYNIILDKVFDNNIEAYEAAGMVLDLFAEMYTNLGESNRALGNRSDNDAGQPGEEPPKKLSDMGGNDSAVGETAKENNIKNTVNNDNVKTETTKDNSIKNPVESDNTAAGTTQGNGAKSIIENKGSPETGTQGESKAQKYSHDVKMTHDDEGVYIEDGNGLEIQEDSVLLGKSAGYNVSDEIIEQGKKITHFDTPDDPIRDILGPGIDSNPEEWNRIIKELENSGVEIIYREGAMGYGPHPSINGKPGQFLIDPNASISALEHEYLHFKQAESEGFPNMQGSFESSAARIEKETASYAIEIQRAQDLGLDNVVEQLEKNLQKEIDRNTPILDGLS